LPKSLDETTLPIRSSGRSTNTQLRGAS
jgi:hypothetical protein